MGIHFTDVAINKFLDGLIRLNGQIYNEMSCTDRETTRVSFPQRSRRIRLKSRVRILKVGQLGVKGRMLFYEFVHARSQTLYGQRFPYIFLKSYVQCLRTGMLWTASPLGHGRLRSLMLDPSYSKRISSFVKSRKSVPELTTRVPCLFSSVTS